MSRRAVILAGGRGTRLRPYTVVLPKPLMPIGEYPIMEVVIRQLQAAEFDHVTLAVNHQAEIIQAYFGDGSKWGLRIDYSLEDRPLGTMGPLRLIDDLPEHFLVMNGDVLTDLDFRDFHDEHVARRELFTISSYRRDHQIDYGVLEVNREGILTSFVEKPRSRFEVSMGVYMVSRQAAEAVVAGRPYGFDELMLDFIARGQKVRTRLFDGYWMDIGRPDDYMRAIDDYAGMKEKLGLA